MAINRSSAQPISADIPIKNFEQVNHIQVGENQAGQRLDNFLLARLKGLPKSHLYKLIRKDEVRVNKARVKPEYKLQVGDIVRLAPVRLPSRQQVFVGAGLATSLLKRILYEDEGLMVLNKPHGMAVHGGSGLSFGVIEALRQASNKPYLELIHRIDKDTSGLLLIAKKRSTLRAIQALFREKRIKKSYQALVYGQVKPSNQLIDAPLERYMLTKDGQSGERRVRISSTGKPSQTQVEVLQTFANASLVCAKPKTGRTHQIRVHCQHIGHPLLGDDKYHAGDTSGAPRLCLHAWQLSIPQVGEFEAPLPGDMRQLIETLRKN